VSLTSYNSTWSTSRSVEPQAAVDVAQVKRVFNVDGWTSARYCRSLEITNIAPFVAPGAATASGQALSSKSKSVHFAYRVVVHRHGIVVTQPP
jgi:hypothetical protein